MVEDHCLFVLPKKVGIVMIKKSACKIIKLKSNLKSLNDADVMGCSFAIHKIVLLSLTAQVGSGQISAGDLQD